MTPLTALSATDLRAVMEAFRDALATHRELINRLNVYPVPDGDTGTNMTLTVGSVTEEIAALDPVDAARLPAVCEAISHGSLMGARGNSGVILSQVLRGLALVCRQYDEIDAKVFREALCAASEAAYGAVMRPVEGTILTVVRDSAAAAGGAETDSLTEMVDRAREVGHESLARTPELLEVLAEAGVVDAGAAGFLLLFDAILHVTDGRPLPHPPEVADKPRAPSAVWVDSDQPDHDGASDLRYEVMYLLEAPNTAIDAFKDVWAGLGDSIVVVGGDGIWNCHIHTNDIGQSIEAAIQVGRPSRIRVTDLAEQVEEVLWVREGAAREADEPAPPRVPVRSAIVAVSPARGIGRIFHSLGVQELVAGGQTMNPSTRELLAAVERAPAEEVIILPNNSNIVAVAQQLGEATAKTVTVVPTSSVTEGFASLLAYDPEATGADNAANMAELAGGVLTGEVTRAVRDSSSVAGPIRAGNWLGLDAAGVRVVGDSPGAAGVALLETLVGGEHEIVTLIEGAEATAADTRRITEWLTSERPDVTVETHRGGQAHYPYWFGVE